MDPFMPMGFNLMFGLFPIMFILVFSIILITIFKSMKTYFYNNKQPIIPVETKVVAKRYNVSRHHNAGSDMHTHTSSTFYYATFELTNGERMELAVPSNEFGMLVEGDSGTLTFQGTRYLGFNRK